MNGADMIGDTSEEPLKTIESQNKSDLGQNGDMKMKGKNKITQGFNEDTTKPDMILNDYTPKIQEAKEGRLP